MPTKQEVGKFLVEMIEMLQINRTTLKSKLQIYNFHPFSGILEWLLCWRYNFLKTHDNVAGGMGVENFNYDT